MSIGVITLTSHSSGVKGNGTAFNTELKAGDFIVSVVGGVTYTLPVKTVDSATQATLIKAYDGPTQAGAAWYAVPRDAMNTITAQLAAETAKALRGLSLDKENWQQVFSGSGNITVKLPDGSTYSGPAWSSITASLNNKLDKTVDTAQEIKGSLSLQGSVVTGQTANLDVGGYSRFRKSTTFDDTIFSPKGLIADGKNNESPSVICHRTSTAMAGQVAGGTFLSTLTQNGLKTAMVMALRREIGIEDYGYISYQDYAGNWHEARWLASGNINNMTGSWVTGSDRRIKTDIEVINDPISLIRGLKLYSFNRDGKPQIGGIAQEIEKTMPLLISDGGSITLKDGRNIEKVKSVDYSTLGYVALAALNQALDRIDRQDELIKELMEKVQ